MTPPPPKCDKCSRVVNAGHAHDCVQNPMREIPRTRQGSAA